MTRWDTRSYIQRLGDSISQFANVLLLNGMTDESISGRSYRNTVLRERKGQPVAWRWRVVRFAAELLFWPIDRGGHTEAAFWQDVERSAARAHISREGRAGE